MERLLSWIKRWWVLAIVFALALSLTSCAKRKNLQTDQNYGQAECSGTLGTFEVYTFPLSYDSELFEVRVIATSLDNPGDTVQIGLGNSEPAYKKLIPEISLTEEQDILLGTFSTADLDYYDRVVITYPIDPSMSTVEQSPEKEAYCELPLPPSMQQDPNNPQINK